MGGLTSMVSWVATAVVCVAVVACTTAEAAGADELAEEHAGLSGTIGCQWWRIRSISNAVGEYWQIKEIEWFESKDGSGNAVSKDHIEKATSSTYKDSPKP